MLRGRTVALRARVEADVPILHSGFYEDVETHSTSDGRAWRPMAVEADANPFKVKEPLPDVAVFTIVALDDDRVVGDAVLWSIDLHNRNAHVGLGILPESRGRGFGLDATEIMCRYAFRTLGLHRLQVETNVDNAAMLAVARRAGFSDEGILREAGWANGRFVDEAVLGLLSDAWSGAES
jgi:RimJ/RimL family protein N-acetyltransferase